MVFAHERVPFAFFTTSSASESGVIHHSCESAVLPLFTVCIDDCHDVVFDARPEGDNLKRGKPNKWLASDERYGARRRQPTRMPVNPPPIVQAMASDRVGQASFCQRRLYHR